MKELAIQRNLSEDTRVETVWCYMDGAVACFSLHITSQGEAILTDHSDYTKIYRVESLELYRAMERSSGDMLSDPIRQCAQDYAKASTAFINAKARYHAESPNNSTSTAASPLAEFKACSKAMRNLLRTVLDEAGFPNTRIIM